MSIFGNKKGIQCEKNPQTGEQTCTRFEVKGGQRISTGSQITLTTDAQTCKVVMSGDVNSILDDEAEDFNKIAKQMESSCRRGLA